MKYRTIFIYFIAIIFLFGLWSTAFDVNSDYWGYVNNAWKEVRFNPSNTSGLLWAVLTTLFGCLLTLVSSIFVTSMTWVGLMEAKKEYKNRRQMELF